jgi:alpha-galactosidase/6-phospho-beta-glucosidase family protein
MKVTVIGSGSISFTRQLVKGMVKSPFLTHAEFALVDIDEYRYRQMGEFCKKVNAEAAGGLKISYATDRCAALPGSDYVVPTFARAKIHLRDVGVHVARRLHFSSRFCLSNTGPLASSC